MEQIETEVAIVGAGPVGLLLACELVLRGVRPLVVERLDEISQQTRAGGFAGQISEVLRTRGWLDRFRGRGPEAPPLNLPWGDLQVDMTRLDPPPLELVIIPQPEIERVLGELALELGVEVRRGHRLTALEQDGDGVDLTVERADGPLAVKAGYVVGCDGGRSAVRRLAGIGFPGTTYPEVQRLAQVAMPAGVTPQPDGSIEVDGWGHVPFGYTTTERGRIAVAVRGDELSLFTSEEQRELPDDDVWLTLDELRASVRRVMGGLDLELTSPSRLSRFTFSARQAERFVDGRVLLAGDAAHLFPAPGVPLNAGMLDAADLGWKLAATVAGWAPDGLLATYDVERQAAAARTMLHTQAQVALRRGSDPAADALRQLVSELLADDPAARRIGELIAAADVAYPPTLGPADEAAHPLVGRFAPDLGVRDGLLADGRGALVVRGDQAELVDALGPWADRVSVATFDAEPTDHAAPGALLVRPDGHVAWAAAGAGTHPHGGVLHQVPDTASLTTALAAWFGPPAATP